VLLRLTKKVVPDPIMARMRRWARHHLPARVQTILKGWERHEAHPLLGRTDAMFQLFEERIEALEAMLTGPMDDLHGRLDALDAKLPQREAELLSRQDDCLRILENRLERLEGSIFKTLALETAVGDQLLSDAQYRRFQGQFHNPTRKEGAYRHLIERWIPEAAEVLDAGCGDGSFIRVLNRCGRLARGVDLSAEMVRACREVGLDIEKADAVEHLRGLASRSLDAVTCLHVVEHLPNRNLAEFVIAAYRVLRPGGLLLIETPKIASLFDLTQYYFIDPTHRLPRHHSLLSFLLEDAGFVEVFVEDVPTGVTAGKIDIDFEALGRSRTSPASRFRGEVAGCGATSAAQPEGAGSTTDGAANPDVLGRFEDLEAWLGEISKRLDQNFSALNEWLFACRDVRIVGRRPDEGAR
jgi:2-polyprenyl-3-methyl-5-hydroxy-6-metoxy-1,4-benzoquinol methylase